MTAEPRLADDLRAFDVGSQLVPDEIRYVWEIVVAARRDWVEWWESFDYDGAWWSCPRPDNEVSRS